ncbi:MAG: DNA repair protein [Peptococcaceae bacterium BICA1-8]|nr:MAG: DNA repair protein [Peptococcaceae bacterium BICA1-8]
MRPIWKGAISFGLVNIPIKLYTATESNDIKFRFLHKECKSPINYQRYCPVCDEKLENGEMVKGYEYESGHFVIMEDEDFAKIPLESVKAIEIIDFVDLSEIDPIYFVKSYFLAPTELGHKPYNLLYMAMQETGKIAIARVVLRSKETLACVRLYENALLMETIFYPSEIRSPDMMPELTKEVKVNENELIMAKNLINSLSTEFNPEKYKSQYREALLELIEAKIQGQEIAIPEQPEAATVVDLMEALKASLAKVEEAKEKPKKRRRKKKEQVEVARG